MSSLTLLDGHNDFPYMIRGLYGNDLNVADLNSMPIGQTDLRRLRQGRLGGQFWSAYIPWYMCPKRDTCMLLITVIN
jgi:membrane dipeptidase